MPDNLLGVQAMSLYRSNMIAKGLISVMSEKLLIVGSLELCFEFKKIFDMEIFFPSSVNYG